jgi:hypothetical protein
MISGTGTGARSCPSARRIGNDLIGNRVLGHQLGFFSVSDFGSGFGVNVDRE